VWGLRQQQLFFAGAAVSLQSPPLKSALQAAQIAAGAEDAALARESALLEFMEVEMGWEYFRAEYNIGDSPSQSLQNAKKLKAFLSANENGEKPRREDADSTRDL
jgi:hypothetical protein